MRRLLVLAAAVMVFPIALSGQRDSGPGLRLYVFDGGTLASADMSRYRLANSEGDKRHRPDAANGKLGQ